MDQETEFLSGLLELHYGFPVKDKLVQLASEVAWAKGWPDFNQSFWNAEAFMWNYKIDREVRNIIVQELEFLEGGKNLDVGCGSYTYVNNSTGFDMSPKMLQFNERCLKKVLGNLEKSLPFSEMSFDSITAVFVFNYVSNYNQLLSEIHRILVKNGHLVVTLYSKRINDWQKQKEVNYFDHKKWCNIIEKAGFLVKVQVIDSLLFFTCRKVIK